MRRIREHSGFTLTEMLVVIGIITLLVSILVPVMAGARSVSEELECQTHLRKLGVGIREYAQEHRFRLPRIQNIENTSREIRVAIAKYVQSEAAFFCPRDPEKNAYDKTVDTSYDWRYTLDKAASLAGKSALSISTPETVIIGGDREVGWHTQDHLTVLYADTHTESISQDNWIENIRKPIR